ncbi:MAG TPA: NUDIX hydrolase [Micromonosporaceae bacterium]|nr:NUDIX hydrolase [Micromonosporaceae bacterium]
MISADEIGKTVRAYLERYPAEAGRLAPLVSALDQSNDLTSRTTFTGHVTCSGIVIDPAGRVLHIRHNVLRLWLRPGGHLEADDVSLVAAAFREVKEETGIPANQLTLVDDNPLDIDVHPIPANPAKGEPEHQHFDLGYLFTTAGTPVVSLQAEEVHDVAWLAVADLAQAILRYKLTAL